MSDELTFTNERIRSLRPPRNRVDPRRPHAWLIEPERDAAGEVVDVVTLFLTNRECPWRCLMCDLWKNTTEETVPAGAIPEQIDFAFAQLGDRVRVARQIKLYNSGSFFDARAIPPSDHVAIAERIRGFERVIVECHPALVNERMLAFRDLLGDTRLEVAMGLETAHPDILRRLNKGITLDSFRRAAHFLAENQMDLRVFVLVKTPWQSESEAVDWALRSVAFAKECGATVTALIPTRPGNGAMEELTRRGEFSPPQLASLEQAFDQSLKRMSRSNPSQRVFADLWDLGKFSKCDACLPARTDRMKTMNFTQQPRPRILCESCGR